MSKKTAVTAFLQVFEQRLKKLKESIKDEIAKPKKERSKKRLRRFLEEAKDLRKLLREINSEHQTKRCPHCNGII